MEKLTTNSVRTTKKEDKYFAKVQKALAKQEKVKISLAEMFRRGARTLGFQLGVEE